MTTKICSKCKQEKDISEFDKDKIRPNYYIYWCKQCMGGYVEMCDVEQSKKIQREKRTITMRKYHKGHKEKRIESGWRQYHIDITCQEYELLLIKQKGVCAICGKSETVYDKKQKKVRRLAVDHNHTTGEIRGLLCWRCNAAIGLLNDDPLRLIKGIEYINKISMPIVEMPKISIWTVER